MEGSLSKWTNMVHGWQYRYFVLSDDQLLYYTSKEKKLRGVQRGYIRLRGAAIGIDGENNSLFTITVDGKTFHLQVTVFVYNLLFLKGRDQSERDQWVRVLERVIHDNSGYYKCAKDEPSVELQKKATLAEQQSHILLEHIRKLEQLDAETEKVNIKRKKTINQLLDITKRLQTTVDLSVVVLQQVVRNLSTHEESLEIQKKTALDVTETNADIDLESMDAPSYSSGEEEFFDADSTNATVENDEDPYKLPTRSSLPVVRDTSSEPDWGDENENFDQIYDHNEESDLGNVQQQHGSVLMHLLSQV